VIAAGLVPCRESRAGLSPWEILIQLQPATNVASFLSEYHVRIADAQPDTMTFRLQAPDSIDMPSLCNAMQNDPRVVSAELNQVTDGGGEGIGTKPLPVFQLTATFDAFGRWQVATGPGLYPQVNYKEAASLADGSGVIVAVLDNGLSLKHKPLAAMALPGWNFIDGNSNTLDLPDGKDNNKNGKVDEAAGHGTMVAGIVAQFAPGSLLLPVKVLDSDGAGNVWTMIQGIHYAVDNGARVIICTFGIGLPSKLLQEAIRDAEEHGAVVIASAGNNDSAKAQYPAGNPRVLTIASLNADNTKASFSNYGRDIDVCAPGVNISSTFWDGTYASWSGTSFSAPMAGAEAALILERVPTLSPESVRRVITRNSHDVDPWNPRYKNMLGKGQSGLIDFDQAIQSLCGTSAD
jgi:subtilisin family serine protease